MKGVPLFLFIKIVLFANLPSMASIKHPMTTFPTKLEEFGYTFNTDGELRQLDSQTGQTTDLPFEFSVTDNPTYNQKHYEALGEVITEYVYELLETQEGMHKLMVPQEGTENRTFIFVTKDVLVNENKLLILVHGSGVVRAGQWARSLIINNSLKSGTQIPYIQAAKENGYAVAVLNTNDNFRRNGDKKVYIKGSKDPKEHFEYVWKVYLKNSKAKHIAIVAHSYGGVCTIDMASKYFSDFQTRVFAIALTDSVHSISAQKISHKVFNYLKKVSRNWVAETEPLDTPVHTPDNEIQRVSAGHPKHEMTSWTSLKSVFQFFHEKYAALTEKTDL